MSTILDKFYALRNRLSSCDYKSARWLVNRYINHMLNEYRYSKALPDYNFVDDKLMGLPITCFEILPSLLTFDLAAQTCPVSVDIETYIAIEYVHEKTGRYLYLDDIDNPERYWKHE